MNLLVQTMMAQIGDLAKDKGFDQARVQSKVNRWGELVIALLVPPRTPDEWSHTPVSDRELRRRARQERS
jgi:hypothetical protein